MKLSLADLAVIRHLLGFISANTANLAKLGFSCGYTPEATKGVKDRFVDEMESVKLGIVLIEGDK